MVRDSRAVKSDFLSALFPVALVLSHSVSQTLSLSGSRKVWTGGLGTALSRLSGVKRAGHCLSSELALDPRDDSQISGTGCQKGSHQHQGTEQDNGAETWKRGTQGT